MSETQIHLRLSDALRQEITDYAEAYGTSVTAAARILIRKGLEASQRSPGGPTPAGGSVGDQHFFVTSVLIEDAADVERFMEAARERFRAVWTLPPGAPVPFALAMYDKDFDGISSAIDMIDTVDVLTGILEHDIHIWEPYGHPERRRVWRVPGRSDELRLPVVPDQDDAQAI